MKPTIYISSTIYDFADLRSSLKYVLEELGYTVLLSDFNDFKKPLDKNSYDSCLAALKEADYFLLLIGQRVGGFVDAKEKISITRIEYREAYKLSQAGQLKLLIFVRKSLWDIREDRKALTQAFEKLNADSKELSEENQKKLINHSSTFVNDAEVTFEFLKEVSKVEEMKAAIKGAGDFPVGNWVHTFSTLGDIMATLNTELNIKNPLQRAILISNLKNELIGNLAALLTKTPDTILATEDFAMAARRGLTGDRDEVSDISGKHLGWLAMYLLCAAPTSNLTTQFLNAALTSGEFLNFVKESHSFEPSLLQNRMLELKKNLDRLQFLTKGFSEQRSRLADELFGIPNDESLISIENEKLSVAFVFQDCELNVVKLLSAILKYLDGDTKALQNVQLNPTSPFPETAKQLKQERPVKSDVITWLKLQS
jgi:hypothetical protein